MFIESEWKKTKYHCVGLDEVGRGPLAGPVVAGGACFKGGHNKLQKTLQFLKELKVTDSKKLTSKKRRSIIAELGLDLEQIKSGRVISISHLNLSLFLYECSPTRIDSLNILQASLFSMGECTHQLARDEKVTAYFDGNKIPSELGSNVSAQAIVKGDSKSALIALASIIAKEYRDFLMEKIALKYPGYGFEKHAGYPTVFHKEAIKKLGITPVHRKTFKGVKEFL